LNLSRSRADVRNPKIEYVACASLKKANLAERPGRKTMGLREITHLLARLPKGETDRHTNRGGCPMDKHLEATTLIQPTYSG